MTKLGYLKELYDEYKNQFDGKEIVLGGGSDDSSLLLVGEAPGKDEVRLSRPFVGKAGKNLSEFLELLGVERDSIYITNAIKYRLSKLSPETRKVSNRPASKEEIVESRDYLLKEVDIISPEYIVTLGNVPLKALTGNYAASIGNMHGQIVPVIIKDKQYKLYPLYHPASIIYNKSLKDVYIKDIMQLKSIIGNETEGKEK